MGTNPASVSAATWNTTLMFCHSTTVFMLLPDRTLKLFSREAKCYCTHLHLCPSLLLHPPAILWAGALGRAPASPRKSLQSPILHASSQFSKPFRVKKGFKDFLTILTSLT